MGPLSSRTDPQSSEFRGTPRFQIVRRLGEGGAGVVYEALDTEQGTSVALKVLRRRFDADALLLFKNEFRSLREIRHPNLVSLGELFEHAGHWFFTMDLLDGSDLVSFVRRIDREDADPLTLPTLDPSEPGELRAQAASGSLLRFDESRLRGAMLQLAQGLAALHAAGKVHRDIKPSNVMVTREGRTVVLDFGLVVEIEERHDAIAREGVVGTARYMAPEQALGHTVGPAADWFAFGVVLYRAMTGAFPFGGCGPRGMLGATNPTAPSGIVSNLPEDLNRLCVELLQPEPRDRPTGDEVLRCLALRGAPPASLIVDTRHPLPLVGRETELAVLLQALDATRAGAQVTIDISGESGIGKSALVRHFCELAARDGALVLMARCDEREWMRYKALDGIVDALAGHLARRPRAEVEPLLPPGIGLLAQVFPVLRMIEAVADERDTPPIVDPNQRRARMSATLREFLARVAAKQLLVAVIDDAQWADPDSFTLLRDLMNPAAKPRMLLIVAQRTGSKDIAPLDDEKGPLSGAVIQKLLLAPLPPSEARNLAASLLDRAGASDRAEAAAIAAEAHGHPLFISELVRHAVDDGSPAADCGRVEDALWGRIRRLGLASRQILQVVTVAGGPVLEDVAAHAVALEFGPFAKEIAALRMANLVRTSGTRRRDLVEAYHDKVRRAVLANMRESDVTNWHARIALALESTQEHPDPEALATHWEAAGQRDRAARYMVAAAEQADAALAFERAVALYRRALDLRRANDSEARTLKEKLGMALSNAGRGPEAARTYLDASDGASAAHSLELRRRAAEQLLLVGRMEEGLQTARVVLEAVGTRLPETPLGALLLLAWRRLVLRVRGLGFVEREQSLVSPHELRRLDVCWSIACGLSMVDTIRGSEFQARHLLLALRVGEPVRIFRALCLEAVYCASVGWNNRERVERIWVVADALADRCGGKGGESLMAAWRLAAHGCALLLLGRWEEARGFVDKSVTLLRERCTGVVWETDTAETYLNGCHYFLGNMTELRRRVSLLADDARMRGDVYATTHFLGGVAPAAWLACGDAKTARQMTDEALAPWRGETGRLAHVLDVIARTDIELYLGDGRGALQRLRAEWPKLRRSLALRVQYLRILALDARARATLAGSSERGADAGALLAEADALGRKLIGEGAPWAVALGRMRRASAATMRGHLDLAARELGNAVEAFDGLGMAMHAAIARVRLAQIVEGQGGSDLTRAAEGWFQREGIRQRECFVAAIAPGFVRTRALASGSPEAAPITLR